MPTMYQPGGGVQRVQIQRVDPDQSISTALNALGGGLQQGYAQRAQMEADQAARLSKAQDILAGAPKPELPGGGISTEMTMPTAPTLPAAQPVDIGGVPPGALRAPDPDALNRALMAANTVPERFAAEDMAHGADAYNTAANSAWQINDPMNISNILRGGPVPDMLLRQYTTPR